MTRLARCALALLAGLAYSVLAAACWAASADPDGTLYAVLSMLLTFVGVMVVGLMALAPVVARQADRGGRR